VARKLAVARFARTLGSLLENGVSMLIALDIVKNIAGNILIGDAIETAAQEVGKGKALGVALSESRIFPQLAIQMIQVGEQSGQLEKMLTKIADVFENEVELTILRLTSYLEPVMILAMGSVVGFIVLSICLPIFEMNQLIR
jgi:general secretion pathway protein F